MTEQEAKKIINTMYFAIKVEDKRVCIGDASDASEALKIAIQAFDMTQAIKEVIAEIEQLNENDYPQMDRTISKFKDIVLDIIYKHTGIGDEYDKGRNTGTTTYN